MSVKPPSLDENVHNYRKIIKHLKAKSKALETNNQYLQNQLSKYPILDSPRSFSILHNDEFSPPPFKNFSLYNHAFSDILSIGQDKIGENFSLEMVFRMFDINIEGKIPTEALFSFLGKVLGISESQIVRIILILDEGFNGFINKENFYKALDSFNCRIELEESNIPKFTIDHLVLKLGERFLILKMTPLGFFQTAIKNRMTLDNNENDNSNKETLFDANAKRIMTYEEFENLWKGDLFLLKELDLKELNMFVNVFDGNYTGRFEKFSFVENMNKLLRRLLGVTVVNKRYLDMCNKDMVLVLEEKQKEREKNLANKLSGEILNQQDDKFANKTTNEKNSSLPIKKDIIKNNGKVSEKDHEMENKNNIGNNNRNANGKEKKTIKFDTKDDLFEQEDKSLVGDQATFQVEINPKQYMKKAIFSQNNNNKSENENSGKELLINAAQKSGKHIYFCFEAILMDSNSPHLGFTVNEIFSKLDFYYGAYLNKKAKIEILKSIDLNNNGVYDFGELKEFFLDCCQGKVSVKTLLLVFAKELQSRRIKTNEIFKLNGINLNAEFNLQQFVEEIKPILGLEFSDISAIFLEICDENAEVNLEKLINILNSLRNDESIYEESKAKGLNEKQQKNVWDVQVQNNNRIRSIILKFSNSFKEKKLTSKELFKRANLNSEPNHKENNGVILIKFGELLKRIFPDKKTAEISEFLDILNYKKTGMINLEDYERITGFDQEKIEVKPLSKEEKEEVKEILMQFLDEKDINMIQFFQLLDREQTGILDLPSIRDGLLAQGLNYCKFTSLITLC